MKETQSATTIAREIVDNVSKVIVGKQPVIKQALAAVIAKGHILIEDVPGVGKTMLAKSISSSIGCSFKRIQFTPDLLPSDIVGVSIYNQNTREFQFRPGPVMAQIVLVDEINRATPKTQSALLEAMEELQVSVDGVTRPLEQPFIVMATQNPIEYEGTFPLPEAQLDRFLMRISLGYPSFTDELSVIEQQEKTHPIDELESVASPEDVIKLQKAAQNVYVDTAVREYIVGLIEATRTHEDVSLGASPRASLSMFRAVRGMAILRDRDYVIPDDVKELAYAVLAHRLILSPAARMRGLHTGQVIDGLLESVAVPGVSR